MAEMHELIDGYKAFYQEYFASGNTLYRDLTTTGQSPRTLIVACSDSRVDPSIITKSCPGDIFVIRNVANLVPPYQKGNAGLHGVSAALEFAVRVLEVKHIIIMGHSYCAGIQTLLGNRNLEDTDFIGEWVNIAAVAKERSVHACAGESDTVLERHCEKESVLLSLSNLITFPWIKSRVESADLTLHGWYFSLESGRLKEYNPNTSTFETIVTEFAEKKDALTL